MVHCQHQRSLASLARPRFFHRCFFFYISARGAWLSCGQSQTVIVDCCVLIVFLRPECRTSNLKPHFMESKHATVYNLIKTRSVFVIESVVDIRLIRPKSKDNILTRCLGVTGKGPGVSWPTAPRAMCEMHVHRVVIMRTMTCFFKRLSSWMADNRTAGAGGHSPLVPVSDDSFLGDLILLQDRERVLDMDCGARWMRNMYEKFE